MAQRHEVVEQVLASTDLSKGMYGGDRNPAQGQMGIASHRRQIGQHAEKRVGYCVQVCASWLLGKPAGFWANQDIR